MSYEYKEDIQTAMGEHINHLNILEDALEELDEVYDKAQAFDEILNIQKRSEAEVWETDEWEDEIERVIGEYESGDSE